MDTPVSKKPKKSMYYKMMRKAGMKKKMETDPTQWAQETPGPAKSSARSMENGDVVRRTGHGWAWRSARQGEISPCVGGKEGSRAALLRCPRR